MMKINRVKFAKDLLDSMRSNQLIRKQKIGAPTVARELNINDKDVYDALSQNEVNGLSQLRLCAWMGTGILDYIKLPKLF